MFVLIIVTGWFSLCLFPRRVHSWQGVIESPRVKRDIGDKNERQCFRRRPCIRTVSSYQDQDLLCILCIVGTSTPNEGICV